MRRQIRFPGGKQEWRYIEVRRCPKCGSCDRLLPDDQVPFKHYSEETIRKVIDDALTEDEELEYEDYPCEATKQRWKDWWDKLMLNAEGQIRSAAYRIMEMPTQFLTALNSLLEMIKEQIKEGWLAVILRLMINTGGLGVLPRAAAEPP